MRSLTPTGLHISDLSSLGSSSTVGALAVDPESGSYYVAVERTGNGGVEVDIIRVDPAVRSDFPDVVASFTSEFRAPFELPTYRSEILDVHYFPDDRSLTIILAGGDIATVQLEGASGASPVEIVGSVDSGIKAVGWSPDEEQLILVTGNDDVVCMSRLFDIIHEEPLRTEDFGEDKFINVGWGSKTTQFHGSVGKAAAKASDPSSSRLTPLAHPTDDGLPIITFRGDAAFFAVSSLDSYSGSEGSRRQIRIYASSPGSAPKLSATSEELPGLEGQISWRPSGNLLSGLVRYGYPGGGAGAEGRWEVAMLERNGLRHGGFPLREAKDTWRDGRVRGLSWNADSEALAIWMERPEYDVVQLWSMKNYHYYLKQEIYSHSSQKRLRGIRWHPEQPLTLYVLGQDFIQTRSFIWDTYASMTRIPHDSASVAVVDGKSLLITPFRTQNTPPPMSSYQIALPSVPVHVAFAPSQDALAVLFDRGRVQYWDLHTRLPDPKAGSKLRGGGKVAEPKVRWDTTLDMAGHVTKQLAVSENSINVLAAASAGTSTLSEIELEKGKVGEAQQVEGDIERVAWGEEAGWVILGRDGMLRSTRDDSITIDLCPQPLNLTIASNLIFALSPSGTLLISSFQYSPQTIATGVTSYTLTSDFLICTTAAQSSHYAPIPTLQRIANDEEVAAWEREWEVRRIERGALAVTACPSSMSLVLQMPRGNLETVYPRPLVLAVVRRDVLGGQHRNAFITCRKHRLDLNVLHDLDPKRFMDNLESFVDQVPEVDYLNLFVSSLTGQDSSLELYADLKQAASSSKPRAVKDKVNSICDALRTSLEQRDLLKYTETILTTHLCKSPADYESGLKLLLHLQKEHPEVVEDAIKYIIFLSDVNQLYDVALGMYDFQLVLMIAQYSQKDPKEYLPFLRELRALDKWEQRFRIDDHLERRESALRSLQQAGPSRFEEASSYLARYELYDEAFKLYDGDEEHLTTIYDLYGDYLYDRRDFYEAAISYTRAGKPQKTLKAYEKAHAWRELFGLAIKQSLSQEAISEMVERVADHLSSRGRHIEASRIYLEYTKDVDSAVDVLCQGHDFAEAHRIISMNGREELIESHIHPALDDAHEGLSETFDEMDGQLRKEVNRLEELRRIRQNDPNAFYIIEDEPDLEGVDVATNATTTASAFTRYTVAPTTAFSQSTRITGQTNRSKHKSSKKRAAGRKGTVDEYEYLLASLNRLVARADEKSDDALTLLRHLLLATTDHADLARSLQSQIINFRTALGTAIYDAWLDRAEILDGVIESGGMGLDGGAGMQKAQDAVKSVVKEWKGVGVLARA